MNVIMRYISYTSYILRNSFISPWQDGWLLVQNNDFKCLRYLFEVLLKASSWRLFKGLFVRLCFAFGRKKRTNMRHQCCLNGQQKTFQKGNLISRTTWTEIVLKMTALFNAQANLSSIWWTTFAMVWSTCWGANKSWSWSCVLCCERISAINVTIKSEMANRKFQCVN